MGRVDGWWGGGERSTKTERTNQLVKTCRLVKLHSTQISYRSLQSNEMDFSVAIFRIFMVSSEISNCFSV